MKNFLIRGILIGGSLGVFGALAGLTIGLRRRSARNRAEEDRAADR